MTQGRSIGRVLQGALASRERPVGAGERVAVAPQRRSDGALFERQRAPLRGQRHQFRQGRRCVHSSGRQEGGLLTRHP